MIVVCFVCLIYLLYNLYLCLSWPCADFTQSHIDSSSRYLVHLHAAFTAGAPHLPYWAMGGDVEEVCPEEGQIDSLGCYMVSVGKVAAS